MDAHLMPHTYHHAWRPRAMSIALATLFTLVSCAWLLSRQPEPRGKHAASRDQVSNAAPNHEPAKRLSSP